MPRSNTIQTNFTAGEVSPLMYGRVDVSKYFNGARRIQNFIVRPQGGITRRPGTQYVGSTKDSSKLSILRRFIFSETQAYVLEFGDLYVRFWADGGQVTTAPSTPLEVATPYTQYDLTQLKFTQSADILYICHPSYQPRKLQRFSALSWTLVPYSPIDGPYLSEARDAYSTRTSLTVSNYGISAPVTASSAIFAFGNASLVITALADTGSSLTSPISAHAVKCTVVAHGLASGAEVSIVGIIRNGSVDSGGDTGINTNWIIKVIDADNFSLHWRNNATSGTIQISNWLSATYTRNGSTTETPTAIVPPSSFIEYRDESSWRLATVFGIFSSTTGSIKPIAQILDVDESVFLTYASSTGKLTADHSLVFTHFSVGQYVRDNAAGQWYQITRFYSDSVVGVTPIGVVSYNYPNTILTVGDITVSCTITASQNTFASTDVGRQLRLNFGGKQAWGYITQYFDAKTIAFFFHTDIPKDEKHRHGKIDKPHDATIRLLPTVLSTSSQVNKFGGLTRGPVAHSVALVKKTIPPAPRGTDTLYANGVTDLWRFGAWSDTSGWPAVCFFHEQRLCFAKTTTEPQTIWGSKSGDYESMAPTDYDSAVTADSAVTYTIASNRANPIQWMETGPVAIIGTLGSEYQFKGTTINDPISPTNVDMKIQTSNGSASTTQSLRAGSAVLHIQRGGNKLREMLYDFTIDAFTSKDLTILSEHIMRLRGGGLTCVYQQEPLGIVWVATADGSLLGMTYERDQEVVAWHYHPLGGQGAVESIECVPTLGGKTDDVYLIVRRTINGSQKRYIERITPLFDTDGGSNQIGMFFVDCGLTYAGSATTTISGLDHLNGATVQVLANGTYVGTSVPSSGSITLQNAASHVTVGFATRALMETLDPEGGSPIGTSQGKTKRISVITARIKDSMPFNHGTDESQLITVQQDEFNALRSGDIRFSLEQAYSLSGRYIISQDKPYALTLIGLMPQMNTTE